MANQQEEAPKAPTRRKCRVCSRLFIQGRSVKGELSGVGDLCQRDYFRQKRKSALAGAVGSEYGDMSAKIFIYCSPDLKSHLAEKAGETGLSKWCRDALAKVSKYVSQVSESPKKAG